jgi:hypothetical protein
LTAYLFHCYFAANRAEYLKEYASISFDFTSCFKFVKNSFVLLTKTRQDASFKPTCTIEYPSEFDPNLGATI